MEKSREDSLSYEIIGAGMKVHSALGPGLLESAYEKCLCYELASRGMKVENQVPVPVRYGGVEIECGFRLDVLVEDCVIVELKAVDAIHPIHKAQALTYLKLTGKRLCMLLNFNVEHFRDGGIQRIVLGL